MRVCHEAVLVTPDSQLSGAHRQLKSKLRLQQGCTEATGRRSHYQEGPIQKLLALWKELESAPLLDQELQMSLSCQTHQAPLKQHRNKANLVPSLKPLQDSWCPQPLKLQL